jgi:hypothetical protein
MLLHVKLVEIMLANVRFEKAGRAVDHMRPDVPNFDIDYNRIHMF